MSYQLTLCKKVLVSEMITFTIFVVQEVIL